MTKKIISAILAAIMIFSSALLLFSCSEDGKNDENFDYLTSDLSNYISIDPAQYKNYKASLQIAKPHDIDVDITILNLLASKKGEALNDGKKFTFGNVSAGDVVSIYYRGYRKDKNGAEIFVDNMCNFGNENPAELEIGSNNFIPGFELDMVGIDFTKANQLVKIKEGAPKDGQIIYVSYTKQLDGSTASKDKVTAVSERIILGKDDIDKKYGEGFEAKLRSLTVGSTSGASFNATIGGKKYNYIDLKIDFATECEKEGTYFIVESYFPYDYQITTLQNQTAYFEVYIQGIVEYEAPEFTDAFVEENLGKDDFGVTAKDLEEYTGTTTEKLRAHIQHLLDKEYEENYRTLLEEAMWNHYHNENVTKVKRYPKTKVDNIYYEYYNDVIWQFENSGGSITNALGESKVAENVDEYAIIYLGLEYAEDQDWRNTLYKMSESLVKERLILYYIMRQENLVPTAEKLAEQVAESKQEYLDEYIAQYLAEYSKKESDYSEEEWKSFVADREKELYDYYDDDYFTEIAYYEIALDTFLSWANVTTLDNTEVADK